MKFDSILLAVGALVLVLGLILLAQRAARLGGLVPRATAAGGWRWWRRWRLIRAGG